MHPSPATTAVPLPLCDDRLIWNTWGSIYFFPAMTIADEIGLFAALQTPATAAEVAQKLGTVPRVTSALLGVLAALDLLAQHHSRFSLTEVARTYLLPDSPYYWGGMLRFGWTNDLHDRMREALQRERQPRLRRVTDIWSTGSLTPEAAKVVTQAMHSHSFPAAMALAQRPLFADVHRMLDVGGGSGAFSIALALQHPELECTIMDLPVVCQVTRQHVAQYGLHERVTTYPADMFNASWPGGYDAVFFGDIFHDWDERDCRLLAERSFALLPSGGQIFLHEMLLSETRDSPLIAAVVSLTMALDTEGQQFTATELSDLLSACGFVDIRIMPSYGYYSLISACKP